MPEAHLESNSGVTESFPGAFPTLSLTGVSKTSVEDVERERVCHMFIRIKVRQIWQSQRHIGEIRLRAGQRTRLEDLLLPGHLKKRLLCHQDSLSEGQEL